MDLVAMTGVQHAGDTHEHMRGEGSVRQLSTQGSGVRKGKECVHRPSLWKASHSQASFKDGLSSTETSMKEAPLPPC